LEVVKCENGGPEVKGGLDCWDLAGSERVEKSGVAGEALKETNDINSGLSALGMVMSQLAKGQTHISYASNVLTKAMKPILTGDARVS